MAFRTLYRRTNLLQLPAPNRVLISRNTLREAAMSKRSRFCLVLLIAIACAVLALPALADSQARIVRLSDVQGSVQIDKNTGLGFESAFLNLPITQGTQLKTAETVAPKSSLKMAAPCAWRRIRLSSSAPSVPMMQANTFRLLIWLRAWPTSTGWARAETIST